MLDDNTRDSRVNVIDLITGQLTLCASQGSRYVARILGTRQAALGTFIQVIVKLLPPEDFTNFANLYESSKSSLKVVKCCAKSGRNSC